MAASRSLARLAIAASAIDQWSQTPLILYGCWGMTDASSAYKSNLREGWSQTPEAGIENLKSSESMVDPVPLQAERFARPESGDQAPIIPVKLQTGAISKKIFSMRLRKHSGTGLVQQTVRLWLASRSQSNRCRHANQARRSDPPHHHQHTRQTVRYSSCAD